MTVILESQSPGNSKTTKATQSWWLGNSSMENLKNQIPGPHRVSFRKKYFIREREREHQEIESHPAAGLGLFQ